MLKYIKRKIREYKQGFPESDLWNLDVEFAKYLLPRLKRFKEVQLELESIPNVPEIENLEDWIDALNKMIESFEIIVSEDYYTVSDYEKIKEGLQVFAKYYNFLWH